MKYLISDSSRFLLNSSVGLLGTVDVATQAGIPYHYQDFGLTLSKWGIRNTAYLMMPLFGPHTVSSAMGLPVDYMYLSVWPYIHDRKALASLYGLYVLNERANLLHADDLLEQAFDPYVFVRNAYLQQRSMLEARNRIPTPSTVVDE